MKRSILALGATTAALLFTTQITQAADDAGKPSKVKTAVANTVAKVRADDDQLALYKAHASLNPKAIEKVDVATARANPTVADAVNVLLKQQGKSTKPEDLVPGVTSKDTTVQGAAGMLSARIYTPDGAGPFPVVVYFHGGGWVIADKNVYDGGARGIAKQANAVVVSVDYRQATREQIPRCLGRRIGLVQMGAGQCRQHQG